MDADRVPAPAQRPEISVIVPVYHVERTLPRALDSLLRQTFPDFELILVNDGGNPEETDICRKYAERDGRIVYLEQENRGLSAARNRGLDAHRGKWIMFVDSDDWVRDDFCEKALLGVRAAGAEMAVFDLVYTEGDRTEGLPHPVRLPSGAYDSGRILRERLSGAVQCYAWNKIYREDLWDGIRFPVGELWEDDAVVHEVIDRADTVAVLHETLYYKAGRPESITARAYRDDTAAYWLWRQRRRRWTYLEERHPELLQAAGAEMAAAVLRYARCCVLRTRDGRGFDEARCWAKRARLPLRGAGIPLRVRYRVFLRSKVLFRLQETLVGLLKSAAAALKKQSDRT